MTDTTSTRSVEVVREALPGEGCINSHDVTIGDWSDSYPCTEPAELVWRITEYGSDDVVELCAQCAEPLKRELAAQPVEQPEL
jgi:hypothetical protein